MKFMLIMNTPRDGYEQYLSWPQKDLEANAAFMQSFTQKLAAAGELVATHGLTSPAQAKLVRKGSDGKPVTDGVFPESKEFLAGWWIVDVENEARACELAAEVSGAPGPGIQGMDHFWIEVRQVLGGREDLG
jgi:hypothetical protein